MLNRYARAVVARLLTPLAAALLRARVSPDAVTAVGALGVVVGALAFYPRGELLVGTLVITAFALSDALDGTMARLRGRPSSWGAFLDSTLDRVSDAAVFGGLVVWFFGAGQHEPTAVLALTCLVLGGLVSYARARAEGLGMTAGGGIAERAERLVAVLVATGLVGFGLPRELLTVALALIALASAVTVGQRVLAVRRQALGAASP